MLVSERSIIIQRSVEEVFAYVADQTNGPRWQDGLIEVRRTTDGPIGLGTRHAAVREFMGQRLEVTNEYVAFEPNREVAFTGASGPLTFRASYRVAPTAEGTRLTSWLEMEAGGLFDAAEGPTDAILDREHEVDLVTLKRLLETGEAVPTASGRGRDGERP